jgi:glucose uptake protein
MRYHLLSLLKGAIWGTGAAFNFVAANKVGVPISYAIGQSSPVIATACVVFVCGSSKENLQDVD